MLHVPGLFIAPSEKEGRGVFTTTELHKGDVIEICPLLIIPESDLPKINPTILYDYYFINPINNSGCIALGYGSLYNHSFKNNAEVVFDPVQNELEIRCTKTIPEGEEILIDYSNGSKEGVWFDVK